MKRLKDNSDVPEAKHGTLPKKSIQAQRKRQGCILLSCAGMGTTKEPEDREFVVDSGARTHTVSEKDLNSAELETMRTSRSPTTVMTANGEVQTREEATVYVKQLDLLVKVMLLEENSRSAFLGESLCGPWVFIPLDQRSKTTSHQKWQEN